MLKKLVYIYCDPVDVLAWEIVEYHKEEYEYGYMYYTGAKHKLVLHVKNNLTFELKIKPDYRVEDKVVNIPNGFFRSVFCRPVRTETVKNFIIIKSVQEKAEELMKEFLNDRQTF